MVLQKPEIKTLLHFWLKLSETSKVVSLTAVAPKKTPNCAKNVLENQTLGTWAEVSQPKVTLPGINPVLAVDRGLKASVCGAFPACCSSRAGFGGSKCRASNKVRIPSVSLNFSGKPVVICCFYSTAAPKNKLVGVWVRIVFSFSWDFRWYLLRMGIVWNGRTASRLSETMSWNMLLVILWSRVAKMSLRKNATLPPLSPHFRPLMPFHLLLCSAAGWAVGSLIRGFQPK